MTIPQTYRATVTVRCANQQQAEAVLGGRLDYDMVIADDDGDEFDYDVHLGAVRHGNDATQAVNDMCDHLGVYLRSDCEPSNIQLCDIMSALLERAVAAGVHPDNFIPDRADWPIIPWDPHGDY